MKTIRNKSAFYAARRKSDAIERQLRLYRKKVVKPISKRATLLRVVPLGGQEGIGEKNMIVLEYEHDALILDCGFELGLNLPGVNYAIPATDYLETIRHKLRGYVISHGHMDHIGGLIHIVPQYPAPIIGSRFTIGMVQAQFDKLNEDGESHFTPDCRELDMDSHERMTLGSFEIELVRVTHAIPESSAIVVDTPAGRVINTGDFRLDPEPLDARPSDIARLKELGDEGVLLLMSESTNATQIGRTPTEHTLQDSFFDLIERSKGRVIIAVFSSNMNRIQMIVNAAQKYNRKIVLDGRSMMLVAEIAVRLGNLKIPKDILISIRDAENVPDDQLIIVCTGGQGEPGAALSRMASGEHKYVTLKKSDNVVISSTPIPGNEVSFQEIGNRLAVIGVQQFRHSTHTLDGCGPLHVSGHGGQDEHADMIRLTRPRYLMPIYGGPLNRRYHQQIGIREGMAKQSIIMAGNGTIIELSRDGQPHIAGKATVGSLLVDQTGRVVPEVVIRDRLFLQDEGFVVVAVTVDGMRGKVVTSPDIITRGHISLRDSTELVSTLRQKVAKMASRRYQSKSEVDLLRHDLRELVSTYLFEHTGHTPMVIAVINDVKAGKFKRSQSESEE